MSFYISIVIILTHLDEHWVKTGFWPRNIRMPRGSRISGTAYVQFVVGKTGIIEEVKVIRGVSKDADAEAIRVVKLIPQWKPGRQHGKPVNVRFVLPIKFQY